jgi:uncharacterized protein YlzI (FlbEa/FlbD family)
MAHFKKFQTITGIDGKTNVHRVINVDHVAELVNSRFPKATKLKLTNGKAIHVQGTVEDVAKELSSKIQA